MTNILFDSEIPYITKEDSRSRQICKKFSVPLKVGEEVTVVMTCNYNDSFTDPRESVIHINTLSINLVVISVTLPKPCIKVEAYKTYGGQAATSIEAPEITNGNKQIDLTIKKPLMGASYHLDWTW